LLPIALGGLLLCALAVPGLLARASAAHHARGHTPQIGATAAWRGAAQARRHAPAPFITGIGDDTTEMFSDPNWQRLHTKIARYVVPYDAIAHPYWLSLSDAWIHAAEASHQQILIAFYHSEVVPLKLPSVGLYRHDVERFIKRYPNVRQYEPWNEANRGYVSHVLASPSAVQSAQFYQAIKRACHLCNVVGLDILDQQYVSSTLRYVAEFKREIGRLRTIMPAIWGLHNYSDTNRDSSERTRAVLAAVPGDIWLTETGGIVKFGGAFPNVRGSGLRRAASALTYMFRLAGISSRIRRLYIYDWHGGTSATRFDAGLTDVHYRPRPGYLTVCVRLHASGCHSVRISSH
jgi:hypothetical protein